MKPSVLKFLQSRRGNLVATMTKPPRKRPGKEEHYLQCGCVRWFRAQWPGLSKQLAAVPNGGRRDAITGVNLKDEGVVAGVADLILAQRNKRYGALAIEMKTPAGRQSKSQKDWQKAVEAGGWRYVVCRSLDDFMREVNDYLADR